jgi:DNA-binding response OmpR family regulator
VARILIVEDDPAICEMLQLILGVEGYETEVITDGTTAVARLDEPPADAVVLDVMMPGLDGLSVLSELRRRPAWADTRVVVASALRSDEDVWKGWTAGADYYLVKPFDLSQLRDVINRLLSAAPAV